jgi:hypothetical protein
MIGLAYSVVADKVDSKRLHFQKKNSTHLIDTNIVELPKIRLFSIKKNEQSEYRLIQYLLSKNPIFDCLLLIISRLFINTKPLKQLLFLMEFFFSIKLIDHTCTY